jgi:hypothetical protein
MKEYKLNPPDVVTVSRLLKADSIYKLLPGMKYIETIIQQNYNWYELIQDNIFRVKC